MLPASDDIFDLPRMFRPGKGFWKKSSEASVDRQVKFFQIMLPFPILACYVIIFKKSPIIFVKQYFNLKGFS